MGGECRTLENVRLYTDCINLRAEGRYCDTSTTTVNCRESRVIKTTRNIGTSKSSSISRDVWAKPIMFIGK